MILDIFSLFDPYSTRYFVPIQLLLLSRITLLLLYRLPFKRPSRGILPLLLLCNTIIPQLARTNIKHLRALTPILTCSFITITIINLLGIAPYIFSFSSHLIFTLSLGLPLWASIIFSSLLFNPYQSMAHLLPEGAPEWLNPFLVLVETTSVTVRPLTLSFRLAANITAGHVVLSLISSFSPPIIFLSKLVACPTILLITFYSLFEFAICLIQRYIFCLLLSLYREDHAH